MKKYDSDPGGPLTAPFNPKATRYNVREIIKFCKEHGISPEDLSDRQLKRFIIKEAS